MEADRSGLTRTYREGETPATGPLSKGVKGSLQLLPAFGEKDNVVRVEQERHPGGVRLGAEADAGGGPADGGRDAVEEDVEQERGQDAPLANALGVPPGCRELSCNASS